MRKILNMYSLGSLLAAVYRAADILLMMSVIPSKDGEDVVFTALPMEAGELVRYCYVSLVSSNLT